MFVKPAGNAYPVGGEGGITAWLLSEGNWTAESQTRIKHTLFLKGLCTCSRGGDKRESRPGTAMFTLSFCFPTSPSPITFHFPETPALRRGPGWKTLLFGAVKHLFRGPSTLACLLAYQTQADISVKRAPFSRLASNWEDDGLRGRLLFVWERLLSSGRRLVSARLRRAPSCRADITRTSGSFSCV